MYRIYTSTQCIICILFTVSSTKYPRHKQLNSNFNKQLRGKVYIVLRGRYICNKCTGIYFFILKVLTRKSQHYERIRYTLYKVNCMYYMAYHDTLVVSTSMYKQQGSGKCKT